MAQTLAQQIDSIQTLITSVQANPRPNYRVGDTTMDWGDYLKSLYEIQFKLQERASAAPSEGWETVDTAVDTFGNDLADYFEAG